MVEGVARTSCGATIPALAPVAPAPTVRASNTMLRRPAVAAWNATDRPAIPPPTMAMSTSALPLNGLGGGPLGVMLSQRELKVCNRRVKSGRLRVREFCGRLLGGRSYPPAPHARRHCRRSSPSASAVGHRRRRKNRGRRYPQCRCPSNALPAAARGPARRLPGSSWRSPRAVSLDPRGKEAPGPQSDRKSPGLSTSRGWHRVHG